MSSRCHLHGLDCMMPDIQQSMNTATTCQKNTKVLNFQYLLLLKYLYLNGQKHEIFWLEWKLWQYKWSNVIVYCLRYFQKFRLTRHAHSFRYWPLANTRKKKPHPSTPAVIFLCLRRDCDVTIETKTKLQTKHCDFLNVRNCSLLSDIIIHSVVLQDSCLFQFS